MKKLMFLMLSMALFFTSCDEAATDLNSMLKLSFTGLSDLGSEEVYEGWLVVDGTPITTGTFTVNANGVPSSTEFEVNASDLAAATMFVLSVEPAVDVDPAPSDLKILSGAFNGTSANLDLGIIADFNGIAGKYIIATPTSAATDDELSGVWFIDNSSGSAVPGLTLPDLTNVEGWTYEGWVVFPGATGPISTGTFKDPSMVDANGAGAYKGSDAGGPPFPGDDFVMGSSAGITFPSDLSSGKIVISVEPVPDNSTAPFLVKPLVGDVPAGAMDHFVYSTTTNLITGTATR